MGLLTLPGFFIAVSKPPLPGGRILIVCVTQNRPFLNHAGKFKKAAWNQDYLVKLLALF